VDIGLKDSGLVHISQLANRYIKSPHDIVSVGDVVTVWVMSVDQERKRVSLTMVKPGTERQRGGPSGGPRRGQVGNEPQREGQGQGRRDRGRGPRPSGSALTSPPVGAAPIGALTEVSPRRPDRERDRERGGPPVPSQGSAEPGSPPGHGHTAVSSGSFGPRTGVGAAPGQGPGRPGGPRGGGHPGHGPGPGGGRPAPGRTDRLPHPRNPARPSRPSPPPPPLSKEALTGSVPLRTFGQLKQLWEARVDPLPDHYEGEQPRLPAAPPSPSSNVPEVPVEPERLEPAPRDRGSRPEDTSSL
jgi:uncharacterized protein